MPFMEHACFMNMLGWSDRFHIEVHRLPPFKPNDYLFEKYKDKGTEKWEIYAWAVREVIAKFGGFKTSNQSNREKILYKQYMRGKTDKVEYQGKIFTSDWHKRNAANKARHDDVKQD